MSISNTATKTFGTYPLANQEEEKEKKGLVDLSLVILKTRKLRFKHRLKAKVTDN